MRRIIGAVNIILGIIGKKKRNSRKHNREYKIDLSLYSTEDGHFSNRSARTVQFHTT